MELATAGGPANSSPRADSPFVPRKPTVCPSGIRASDTPEHGRSPLRVRGQESLGVQPLPESLRRARRAARGVVERWHPTESDLVDRAELVVGELLANSYLHAGPTADGAIGLALTGTSTGVLVVVEDGANTSGSPDIREPCETGRGLALVDSASNSWSWHTNRAGGRTTWAFVSRTGFGAPA